MFKRKSINILILIFSILMVLGGKLGHAQLPGSKHVLLIYDTRVELDALDDKVFILSNLLGHFNVDLEIRQETEVLGDELDSYDYVFILSNEGAFSNLELLAQLPHLKNTVCWLGVGLASYNQYIKLPMSFHGISYDYTKIFYNNGDAIVNQSGYHYGEIVEYIALPIIKVDNEQVGIYCTVSDGLKTNPYVIRYQNFWYISNFQIWGDLFYTVADVLYSVFSEMPASTNKVFIRIEDVHPFRNQRKLRAIADFLHEENIPFMVALIPAFTNPQRNYTSHLAEVPGFVETIHYMVDKGASIVMHGYTHAGYGEVSGEGFEFWDGINNQPIQDVNEFEYIHHRIYQGLKTCVENGIYPLAFEPPHYAISITGIKQVSKYFSTFCGQLQSSNVKFSTVTFPYELKHTPYFEYVVPENLGYIHDNYRIAVQEIIDRYHNLEKVRGFTAGMFYHPNIKLKYLKELVGFFQQQEIEFFDLSAQSNWVKCEEISIYSDNGSVTAKYRQIEQQKSVVEVFFSYVNVFLLTGLTFVLTILIILFLRSRQLRRIRFSKGREDDA